MLAPTDDEAKKSIESSAQCRDHFDKMRRNIDRTRNRDLPADDF